MSEFIFIIDESSIMSHQGLNSIFRNVFLPEKKLTPEEFLDQQWLEQEVYVTTESMLDLVLEMEEANRRIAKSEAERADNSVILLYIQLPLLFLMLL